jgi:hypothetical protein
VLFFGQKLKEGSAHIPGQGFAPDLEIEERPPHALPLQFLGADVSVVVPVPKDFVVVEVGCVKDFEISDALILQPQYFIQIQEGFPRIEVKIPQGMIQVKKNVPVLHDHL